jgi:hypothetical protein
MFLEKFYENFIKKNSLYFLSIFFIFLKSLSLS